MLESISHTSSQVQSDVAFSPPPLLPQYFIAKDRPKRDYRPPKRYGGADLVAYVLNKFESIDSNKELSTYSVTISYDNSSRWIIIIQEEMESLNRNGAWDLV